MVLNKLLLGHIIDNHSFFKQTVIAKHSLLFGQIEEEITYDSHSTDMLDKVINIS